MGKVLAVCISEKRGTQKKNVEKVRLIENYGLEGDAHAGNWHRQVSVPPMTGSGSSMKEEPVWTMAHLEKILSWKDLISRVFRWGPGSAAMRWCWK